MDVIAQLSDIHVMAAGMCLGGLVDTNTAARAAVAAVNALEPAATLVLVTGDLTETGAAAEYAETRLVLDGLEAPYYVIPGNHDRRAPLMAALGDHCGAAVDGLVAFTIDDHDLRLIGLDSLVEGEDQGRLGGDQLAWLDAQLTAEPDRPTMVFLHHPPFDTGIWWMDTARLADAHAFGAVLEAHGNVVQVVCGHVHRSIHRSWCGITVSICPSTAFEIVADLGPEAPPRAVLERPAFHLHRFDGHAVVTHLVRVGDAPPRLDLAPLFTDYEATKAGWRERARLLD